MQHVFETKSEAVKALSSVIIQNLTEANNLFGSSRILLSGGGTPGPLYKFLNRHYVEFDKTTLGLVDERFVDRQSEFSNERLIRECMPNVNQLIGMIYNTENYLENIKLSRINYEIFKDRTDVVVLGMGTDGHTASLFPNDPNSQEILDSQEIDLFNTNAPGLPLRRITCSKAMLTKAKHIYLLIFGKEKLDILNDRFKALPIHILLRERNDIQIYYAEY